MRKATHPETYRLAEQYSSTQVLLLAVGVPAITLLAMGALSYPLISTVVVLGASTVLLGGRLRQYFAHRAKSSAERTAPETGEAGSASPLENVERHRS